VTDGEGAPDAKPPRDIRPSVVRSAGKLSLPVFLAVLGVAGGGLFYALQINRLNKVERPLTDGQDTSAAIITSPAPLAIPAAGPVAAGAYFMPSRRGPGYYMDEAPILLRSRAPRALKPAIRLSSAPSSGYSGQSSMIPGPGAGPYAAAPPAPAVVFQAPPISAPAPLNGAGSQVTGDARVKATVLSNPSTTVPQGSVIHAVMETALDSTRPGFARAIVSRDVMSFDGSRVLVPKGSKLFGEYKADLSLGEKRALIQWHRLTRPDGVIIDVNSPAADPLGRAGLKGKVNTHFFERFGGVILQSILDLGVRAATREASRDTIILGAPPAVQGAIAQQPGEIRPTLKVRQGASITVFVGRDLDFSAVE